MPWKATYLESAGTVELVLSGTVTGDDLRAATSEGIGLVGQHGVTRGLIDATEQVKTGSMVDLVELPQQYSDQGLSRDTRIALVLPVKEDLHGIADFYETVCVNRGWQVQTFAERDAALAWLLAGSDTS